MLSIFVIDLRGLMPLRIECDFNFYLNSVAKTVISVQKFLFLC